MSWWELRRIAAFVGTVAFAAVGVAVAGSALFGGISRSSLALWLLLIALPLLLTASGSTGPIPFGRSDLSNAWGETVENDMLARRIDANREVELKQQVQMSWSAGVGLAGVVVLLLCAAVVYV